MAPLISITAASQNTPEWAELLIKSIRKFTSIKYEIIIIDNGSTPESKEYLRREAAARRIRLYENRANMGHGFALDQGTKLAQGRFVCAMDIDAFFLRDGWAIDLIALYESDPAIRLIARAGKYNKSKPMAPPIFFYEREYALNSGLAFVYAPGKLKGSTDTAMAAYWQILDAGHRVQLLDGVGSMATNPGGGDIVEVAGKPTIYHHYYGARFRENWKPWVCQKLDGRTLESHLKRKAELFNLPIVKQILTHGEMEDR